MRVILVAGFLEVVLQLFLRIAAALAHCAHLLRGGRGVGMQMRACIIRAVNPVFLHRNIVPPQLWGG